MVNNVFAPPFYCSNLSGKKKQENNLPSNGSAFPGKKLAAKQIKIGSDKKTYRRKATERSLSGAGATPGSCVASQSTVLPVPTSKEAAVCTSAQFTAIFTEKWAGPCFAVSPSPSSLPIPSFSNFLQQRSHTLQMASCEEFEEFSFSTFASTPPSPYHESSSSVYSYLGQKSRANSVDAATATKHLRKILNLDL
ncbi:hypothetical protein O6H91_17G068500 [Diphasiastrum complanatum]|nr:hypothetical protein O6H91_17G068500 [Diphasiastrum complanatum]